MIVKPTNSKYLIVLALLLTFTFALTKTYAEPKPGNKTDNSVEAEEEPGSGIFKQIDKDGRVIFTDNPNRERADTEVELKDLNMHSGKDATPTFPRARNNANEEKALPEYRVWIQSPTNEAQIGPALKTIEVNIGVSRSTPHYIHTQLYWNGQPYGKPQINRNFSIPVNLKSRGRRSLQASLINTRTNEVLARSDKIDVYVIRP